MKRQLVYIAGAYRSKWGIIGRIINIWRAYRAARRLTRQGYVCIVPHMETALMDGIQSDEWFLAASLKKLRHCDMIFMIGHWTQSEGAVAELAEAKRRGLKVWFEHRDKPEGQEPDLPEVSIPPVISVPLPYKLESVENKS